MTVIHISFDFPDKIDKRKTVAVRNLVNSYSENRNIVFSLNRTATRIINAKVYKEEHGFTLQVTGFPFGVLLIFWMFVAYRRILKIIEKEVIKPDMIHAHKLTFEGVIAYFLARKLKVPFITSVRGADVYVLTHKRLSRSFYGKIIRKASRVIFIAPWAIKPMQKFLGERIFEGKTELLPNIENFSLRNGHRALEHKRFVTVFRFKSSVYNVKNIDRMIRAFDSVFSRYPQYGLDIIGDGPLKEKIISDINQTRHPQNFFLKGEIENSALGAIYPGYLGFVLPSFPETFGLVFVEALSAGIPVVYSRNAGIDGYFDDYNVGVAVDHRSIDEIAAAIENIIQNNEKYKQNVESMIESGYLQRFSRNSVGENYSKILENASKTRLINQK